MPQGGGGSGGGGTIGHHEGEVWWYFIDGHPHRFVWQNGGWQENAPPGGYGWDTNTSVNGPGSSPGGGSSSGGGGGSGGGPGGGSSFPLVSNAYMHAAIQYGLRITAAQVDALMRGGVSPDEFAQRLAARQTLEEYRPSFNIFGQILQNNGVIKGNLTDKELLNFTLGAAPAKWYALWERTAAATAAQKSGYSVYGVKGKGGSPEKDLQITGDDIKSLLNLLPDRVLSSSDVQQGFATASQLAQQIGGETRYRSTGITRADLIHHAFGVADANTEEKINRAIETQQNETQIQNQGGLQQTGTGVQNIGLRGLAGANSL